MPETAISPNTDIINISDLIMDATGAFHYTEFQEISRSMLTGYSRFTKLGLPGQTVALAMLSATVNLYHMFEIYDALPQLLRELALRLESEECALKRKAN
jgi:hypothetical protein